MPEPAARWLPESVTPDHPLSGTGFHPALVEVAADRLKRLAWAP